MQRWLQWKSSQYYIIWICVFSLWYPASNLHSPCCHLGSVRFSTLSHKLRDFKKKSYWPQKVCFEFLYDFVWNSFHSKKNWAKYDKNAYWSLYYSLSILKKLEFSRKIFEKISKVIKFHENPCSRSRDVPCGMTDRHDEAKVAFSNFANAPKNSLNSKPDYQRRWLIRKEGGLWWSSSKSYVSSKDLL